MSRIRAAAALCLCILAAGCGGGGSGNGSSNGGALIGAGSTFVFPLVAKWIPDYSKKHGVTITYGPIGSGGGIKGGMAYVDTAYSIKNGFNYASLQNKAGTFVLPTTAAVAAAAQSVQTIPADNSISIVDPPASAARAYPLSTFTYAIVPEKSGKADLLKAFLTYAITDGQSFAPALEFAGLPQKIVAADRKTIGRIRKS